MTPQPRKIEFFAPGIPRPGGSKKGFVNPKTGRVMIVKAGGQNEENWRQAVAYAAMRAMDGRPPLDGPVSLVVTFVMPRPKYHYHTAKRLAGELRQDAPGYHVKAPDRTKLMRSTEDAMTGIVYRDDSQVCTGNVEKRYGSQPGAVIAIESLLVSVDVLDGKHTQLPAQLELPLLPQRWYAE